MIRLVFAIVFFLACSDDSEVIEYRDPKPTAPPPAAEKPVDEEPKPIPPVEKPEVSAKDKAFAATLKACSSCHNPGFQSPDLSSNEAIGKRGDRVCVRVKGGTMPPGGNLDEQLKQDIIKGFGC